VRLDIAALGGESYAVVWTEYPKTDPGGEALGGDGDDCGVFGRVVVPGGFSADQFQVNVQTAGQQRSSRVVTDGPGTAVAIWLDGWEGEFPIKARVLDGVAGPTGPEKTLATVQYGVCLGKCVSGVDCVSVAAATCEPGFILAWSTFEVAADAYVIRAQRFAQHAIPASEPIFVNTSAQALRYYPTVTCIDGGGYVVAWTSGTPEKIAWGYVCGGCNLRARRFGQDGEPLGEEFVVVPPTLMHPDSASALSGLDGGGFMLVSSAVWNLHGHSFGSDGTPTGSLNLAGPFDSMLDWIGSISLLSNGELRLVWGMEKSAVTGEVGTRTLDPAGQPASDVLWLGDPSLGSRGPNVAALPGGESVIVWHLWGKTGIYALRLDESGKKLYH